MDSYKLFNWGLLVLTFGLLIYLGYLSSRMMKKSDESGFLVAGRSLGAFVGAGTIVATGFSGWGFMGSPGVAYQFGAIEVLGNFFFAPAMVIAVLYFASFLQRKAADMGSNTIPEYIAQSHGGGTMGRVVQGIITLFIIFVMKSPANSLLHTVASATSHDLRLALFKDGATSSRGALFINRGAVMVLGVVALLMMLYVPPFMLSWLGILGTGTLLASMIGPVFISTFWQGSAWGALVAMLVGFFISGYMMLFADVGWLIGPLTGCAVSSACYVGVSLCTRRPRLVGTPAH